MCVAVTGHYFHILRLASLQRNEGELTVWYRGQISVSLVGQRQNTSAKLE